jgi:hypothetical protein
MVVLRVLRELTRYPTGKSTRLKKLALRPKRKTTFHLVSVFVRNVSFTAAV